ncbi:unnamed protein product [Larinioides sclopetarius]|uniref:C2H2-type domain-containing protein n=1 Tax=Larinioides sclopetarius TaxID=280406 RepID=A0AAV2ALI7_9ARAC
MQHMYETSNKKVQDFYHVVEENTGSKIVYRHCGCDKCYKIRDNNQCNFNKICIKNDDQCLVSDLIKPCSVFIRRLDLRGHNGNTFNNCCPPFPKMSNSEKSVISNKIGNSIVEDGIENLSERNTDSVRKQMDLLFESLCETFNLLRAKKKYFKQTKKVDYDIFSCCNSRKTGIKKISRKLIGTLHQGRNGVSKSSKISKPCIKNSSHTYNISYLPTFKSVRRKFNGKENFKNIDENRRHSYEGTDSEIENETRSEIGIKSMQIRYLSSSEVYTNHRTDEIPKNDSGFLVDRRNNYSVPLVGSSTKTFSRFPAKSNQDKAVQAHDSRFPLNNSNPYCASNPEAEDFEKVKDYNKGVKIEIVEEHITQKNVKRTTKNYSVYLSNHKIRNIEKDDSTVIRKSESGIQILGESVPTRKLKERNTNKCLENISEALINENSHECESEGCFEEDDSAGNKYIQTLNKSVKPCSVFIELMDEKMINFYCNHAQTFAIYDANNFIPQIKTVGQYKVDSCLSSDLLTPPATIGKISNRSSVEKFTARNEQTFKYHGIIPLIKPCSVVIDKLPFNKYLKFINPTVINSFCNENASYHNVVGETESYISAEKNVSQCEINLCFSSPYDNNTSCISHRFPHDSSTIIDAVPNVDAFSELPVINGQTRKYPRKTPLVKPCCVIKKFLVDEKLLARKSSIKRQCKLLKFKRRKYINNRKSLLHKKKMLIKCTSNKKYAQKFNKPFVCKKWKKESKVLNQIAEEWEKDLRVKENLNNNGINMEKISSSLLRENQYICNTSSDISTCSSSHLVVKDCFVLLERINVDKYLVETKKLFNSHYNLKCSTSLDVLPKCHLSYNKIRGCYVLLERINLDKCLAKSKNIFNQCDSNIPSENLSVSKYCARNKNNRYKIDKTIVPNPRLKLKRGSPLRAEDASKLKVKKLKKFTDYYTLEKAVKNVKTVYNNNNLICDFDYKCVQCRKSITSDVKLYHHLCCGKRKKGYICDICEKIFETIPRYQKHLNYHYKFIKFP